MSRPRIKHRILIPGCLAAMVALLVACSTDTPTAPTQEPSTPTPGINAFIMSISVSPDSLDAGSETPATVTVRATNRDTGASPANGTSVRVSANLGEFLALGSEIQSTAAIFDQGRAQVFWFPGDTVGTASLRADLSGSVGRTTVAIRGEEANPFITGVTPTSGPAAGGTTVTITGTGFREPLRVSFGTDGGETKLGQVLSVTSTEIKVVTPELIPDTEVCDILGDIGRREIDTPVTITVDIEGLVAQTLSGGYTIIAGNTACSL